MKNKIVIIATFIGIAGTLLTGCGHEHTWTDATCDSPKTCSECGVTEGEAAGHTWEDATCAAPKTCSACGETEGDALEHTWVEADCENPKTCSVCGETEGEALGHEWVDATYWSSKTCDVCGATEGDALTPDFEKYGMPINLELDESKDFITVAADGKEGSVKVYNYSCYAESDEIESIDGYVFQEVYKDHKYIDPYNMVNVGSWTECYYDIKGHDDTAVDISDSYPHWDYAVRYTLPWQGEEYTECIRLTYAEWVGNTYRTHYIFRVPEGYDGNTLGTIDVTDKEGSYSFETFDENSLFVRLPAAVAE